MELIDKAAVVAEITNIYDRNRSNGYIDVCNEIDDILSFLDTLETKEVDLEKKEEKLNKAIKLADAMYDAAQRLTTDASRLHKAMQDWWKFRNNKL